MDLSGFSIVGHLFSRALKQKRVIFSVLLIAVVMGTLTPSYALAVEPLDTLINIFSTLREMQDKIISGEAFVIGAEVMAASMVRAIGGLYIIIGREFANLSYQLFDYIANIFVKNESGRWAITNNRACQVPPAKPSECVGTVFLTAWNITKQWANIIIVIALIAVALAFMLNISALENYRKLLLPILAAALFINFSGILVGFLIDISNVAMLTFLGPGVEGGFGSGTIFASMQTLWAGIALAIENQGNTWTNYYVAAQFTTYAIIFGVIFIMTGITTLIVSILFIVRYVMLVMLFIVSPLAFAVGLLPIGPAKAALSKWFGMLIHWAVAGVVAAFFTNLGLQMAHAFYFAPGLNLQVVSVNNIQGTLVPIYVKNIIVIIFLLAGMYMAIKSGTAVTMIMGAAAGLATGSLSLAGKVGSGTFKSLAPGAYDRVQRARDTLSDNKILNPIRDLLAGPGASATLRQNRMQARMKEYLPQMENLKNKELAGLVVTGSATKRAAAMSILTSRDSLDELKDTNPEFKKAAMKNLMEHDNKKKPSDFAKSDYRFAQSNDNTKALARKELGYTDPNEPLTKKQEQEVEDRATKLAMQQQLIENASKMSGNQFRGIDPEHLAPDVVTSLTPNMIKYFKTGNRELIEALGSPAIEKAMRTKIEEFRAQNNNSAANKLKSLAREIKNVKISAGVPLNPPKVKRLKLSGLPEVEEVITPDEEIRLAPMGIENQPEARNSRRMRVGE